MHAALHRRRPDADVTLAVADGHPHGGKRASDAVSSRLETEFDAVTIPTVRIRRAFVRGY